MIKKGCVFLMIGMQVILSAFKVDKGNMEMEQSVNKFCDISEFEDLNYCLVCDTSIITGPSDNEHEYAILGNNICTIERLAELQHKLYLEGYDSNPVINEQGDLMAVDGFDNDKLFSIWNIKDGTNIWNCSTKSVPKNQSLTIKRILQFWGDEKEGKVIMQIGDRDFYEVSYPSGDMKYIGRDMFSLCYSPDRKYAAYSNCDQDDYYDFDERDYDEVSAIPKGIYILEVETGRIAFIEQDSKLNCESRCFQWIEKMNILTGYGINSDESMEENSMSTMSMTTDEVSDYLKKCKKHQHFKISILESMENLIRIWFPNLDINGWGWSIVDKTEEGYIANIYNDDIWDETGNAETEYCAYKAQILIKPDWSMELLPDTIEVNPRKGFCIYASDQELAYNGCELGNYHTEYYIEKKNFYLDASVPLFSIENGLEGNEINRAIWKTLKKWADEQENWVNGEALLDYEIMRLDNDLFSLFLSGEWNPEDGETEKIAIGITISMSDGKPLEESVFTGESEKDSYFGYFIKENEIFLIENRGNHYITVKKGDADFKGYFVERKSANVYTSEGEWRGECYFDLLQIYYIVNKAETINKESKKEMGKFFDGLAQTFQEEIKKIEGIDDPSEGPGYYCNVESRVYKNDGKEFGIEYHYKLWLEEIHEEGDAVICFDIESGEILEYQDWQNEMIKKIELWKKSFL